MVSGLHRVASASYEVDGGREKKGRDAGERPSLSFQFLAFLVLQVPRRAIYVSSAKGGFRCRTMYL